MASKYLCFQWILLYANTSLEKNAVKLCGIEPNDRVLEIGYGPGVGLRAAHKLIQEGAGTLYGIDRSSYMMDVAKKRVASGVRGRKVVLFQGCASNIPLTTDSIDCVYHCNSYYFWTDIPKVLHEVHRVMKPGARIVTTFSLQNLKEAIENGALTPEQVDHENYMRHLESCGFDNVRLEQHVDQTFRWKFHAVSATATK